MKKNIFKSILFVGLCIFLITFVLVSLVLYNYHIDQQQIRQLDETRLIGHAVENEGKAFFNNLDDKDFRITWIDTDGKVLYDSDYSSINSMDNHLTREEIKQALSNGEGQSIRYSATLTNKLLYSAVKLNDGTVIRLSSTYYTIWFLAILMIQPILIITILAVLLSILFANKLSKRIINPINEIDLDDPLKFKKYPELNPFLMKIFTQQNQLKKQKKLLDNRNEEFEAITSNIPEGMILLNIKRDIISINKAALKILEIDNTESKRISDIYKIEEIKQLINSVDSNNHKTISLNINNKQYEIIASPIIYKDNMFGYVLLFIDETERKMVEKIRKDFTANASHELKTPLQVISGYSELLSQNNVSDENKKVFVEKIYSESQRMISLVNDIVNLSQLEENEISTQLEKTDVNENILLVLNSLKEEANSKNISLNYSGEKLYINAIPRLLQGMIYNVCDNAIKYNKENGRVDISLSKLKNKAIIKISDTGVGISEEDKQRVFERFYRVNKSRSKESGGTGLGLSIVKHTVERFSGEIELESEIGVGTTITIKLPIVEE